MSDKKVYGQLLVNTEGSADAVVELEINDAGDTFVRTEGHPDRGGAAATGDALVLGADGSIDYGSVAGSFSGSGVPTGLPPNGENFYTDTATGDLYAFSGGFWVPVAPERVQTHNTGTGNQLVATLGLNGTGAVIDSTFVRQYPSFANIAAYVATYVTVSPGARYYDTTDKTVKFYDGTNWVWEDTSELGISADMVLEGLTIPDTNAYVQFQPWTGTDRNDGGFNIATGLYTATQDGIIQVGLRAAASFVTVGSNWSGIFESRIEINGSPFSAGGNLAYDYKILSVGTPQSTNNPIGKLHGLMTGIPVNKGDVIRLVARNNDTTGSNAVSIQRASLWVKYEKATE